ncbi:right-handed parallel beta-helix repeat-containing protein [bacterium]|nr:right-handed parallel beta-helix repeat-containing protein [bacterium]
MKYSIFFTVLFCMFLLNLPCYGATLQVPEEWSTIQAAIDRASDGDTVSVADGTYSGEGNVDLELRGKLITVSSRNGPDSCIIDCQGEVMNAHRGFHIKQGETQATVIKGFTITNGWVKGLETEDEGGAIRIENSAPTISNCVLSGNTAQRGGGIYAIVEGDYNPRLIDTVIANNAADASGGGIYTYRAKWTIINCTIRGNTATDNGGGIAFLNNDCIMYGTTVESNTADVGGGFYLDGGKPKIVNCDFVNDKGRARSGGLHLDTPRSGLLTRSRITGNRSVQGGGGGLTYYFGSLNISCCLFTGNQSETNGAAMSIQDGLATISNCTITDNISSDYSALYFIFDDYSEIINCIIWNTQVDEEIYLAGSTTEITYSNVQGGMTGAGNLDSDPLFVAGPQGDYYLSHQSTGHGAFSPCVNSGNNDADQNCYLTGLGSFCMSKATTRTDEVTDALAVDMGYHYSLPDPDAGMTLYLDDKQLMSGDTFNLYYDLYNASVDDISVAVWILLDVYNLYWCYPSWVYLEDGMDFQIVDVKFLRNHRETVLQFPWPSIDGSATGLRFWGVSLDNSTSEIIGTIRSIEWSYL